MLHIMVPNKYQKFISILTSHVNNDIILMTRIDYVSDKAELADSVNKQNLF
jgi:hypothetical protein